MTEVRFIVWGDPVGKQRPRVVNGHAYTPDKTVAYEHRVLEAFRRAYPDYIRFEKDVPLRVRIRAFYAIPQSASKKAKAAMQAGLRKPLKKPDADNIEKIICDALNKFAYHDDAQIVDVRTTKDFSDEPRVEIEITELKI